MGDIVELLMVEHQAIRHLSRYIRRNSDEDLMGFHEYLKNVHIEIEEKIVFPILLEVGDQVDSALKLTIDQLIVDHKSIDSLESEILSLWKNGRQNTAIEKTNLYFRLLWDHNLSEDNLVFPLWKKVGEKDMIAAMNEARSIIDNFGRDIYTELIGLSSGAYQYLTK